MIHEVRPCVYEIPIGFVPNMKVPGIFYASPEMAHLAIQELQDWLPKQTTGVPSILQIAYTATLDSITKASFGMPDMHSGYGFSIGGVAAFDLSNPKAIIVPGGIGYDINCGVRCIVTNLTKADVEPVKHKLIEALYKNIPVGIGGKKKKFIKKEDIYEICMKGAQWALENGFGESDDLKYCEEGGCVSWADVKCVSDRCIERGLDQLGTVGSGNHYVEIQTIDRIFDDKAANVLNLHKDQVVVMIHTGSRGLGYQIASDWIVECEKKCSDPNLPDKQYSYIQYDSPTGRRYMKCMGSAINFGFCNRQVITHFVRESFHQIFPDKENMKLKLLYDVAHNIAKVEKHAINGEMKEFLVHRKGATRAFGPGSSEIPAEYRSIGQPVLIGVSMGTASYILVGTEGAEKQTFGSTCHGAGRVMSRTQGKRDINGQKVKKDMDTKGIELMTPNKDTILEEAPETYKDVEQVVNTCKTVNISKKVARLLPLGVIKG
ncbi:hypothetical protein TRFO_03642 [Tritrichomonas foetus]|uniref:3'-phosphate/5'-hydroxy nucleic acid ligase n=1 Tax=Tritrichomonas foetus TaxID=1144522 RepID=A0A1J4KNV6_9EUKA|nr:hypothetical protein TRFO_03642 [Tritrichomonas foetus]|eukprot:OHT12608.1 hypothetical protein TRFO_03642 [Tritrichomonas foetus]